MEVINPTSARKNFYNIIKDVVDHNQPIEISNLKQGNESVVMVSKNDWESIQETLYLQQAGVLDNIKKYEDEETEDLGEINWDTL